jgi:hypothetical protein
MLCMVTLLLSCFLYDNTVRFVGDIMALACMQASGAFVPTAVYRRRSPKVRLAACELGRVSEAGLATVFDTTIQDSTSSRLLPVCTFGFARPELAACFGSTLRAALHCQSATRAQYLFFRQTQQYRIRRCSQLLEVPVEALWHRSTPLLLVLQALPLDPACA